jgi:hypothetical protein
MRGRAMKNIQENDRFFFGLFQREDNPWQLLDSEITRIQRKFRGEGNVYVTHSKLKEYSTQVIARQTEFWRGGQDAVNRVDAGPDAVTTDGRGNRIITVDTYNVEGQPEIDVLKNTIV